MSHAALAFDTLQYAKKLKGVGFTEQQAEVQAEALKEQNDTVQEFIGDTLATKQDMKQLEVEIKRLEVELKQDMKRLEVEIKRIEERLIDKLTARFYTATALGVGFLSALIVILKVF